MDLLEFQGKQFFAQFGIPVSEGDAAQTVDEAVATADRVGDPGWSKPGHAGGRATSAHSRNNSAKHASRPHISAWHQGSPRRRVVDHASDIAEGTSPASPAVQESISGMLSPRRRRIEVSRRATRAHRQILIDPATASRADVKAWSSSQLNPQPKTARSTLAKLYRAYVDGDADLV